MLIKNSKAISLCFGSRKIYVWFAYRAVSEWLDRPRPTLMPNLSRLLGFSGLLEDTLQNNWNREMTISSTLLLPTCSQLISETIRLLLNVDLDLMLLLLILKPTQICKWVWKEWVCKTSMLISGVTFLESDSFVLVSYHLSHGKFAYLTQRC